MCFNEGNPLHYGFVVYTLSGMEKKKVYCAMRTVNTSDGFCSSFLKPTVFFLKGSAFSIEPMSRLGSDITAKVLQLQKEGLSFHRCMKSRSDSSAFIFQKGNGLYYEMSLICLFPFFVNKPREALGGSVY